MDIPVNSVEALAESVRQLIQAVEKRSTRDRDKHIRSAKIHLLLAETLNGSGEGQQRERGTG